MFGSEEFNIPSRAAQVTRFTGSFMIGHRSTIAEHSFEVAFYCNSIINRIIKEDPSIFPRNSIRGDILQYALVHDVAEVYTGDLPFPVKSRYPELKSMLGSIEENFMAEVLPDVPKSVDPAVEFIVKIADTIAVAREILQEVELGNPYFKKFIPNINKIFSSTFTKYAEKGIPQFTKIARIIVAILNELGFLEYVKIPPECCVEQEA